MAPGGGCSQGTAEYQASLVSSCKNGIVHGYGWMKEDAAEARRPPIEFMGERVVWGG